MLTDIEKDLGSYQTSIAVNARGSERLFQRLETLSADMKENDRLIGEAMKKMQLAD